MINKDFMKARTLVLMLSICMLFFTGFGNTTTDLTKNSKANSVDCVPTTIDAVSVVVSTVFYFNNKELVQQRFDNYAISLIPKGQPVLRFYIQKEIRPGLVDNRFGHTKIMPYRYTETKLKPDITIALKNSDQFAYRRARDGLNYSIGQITT